MNQCSSSLESKIGEWRDKEWERILNKIGLRKQRKQKLRKRKAIKIKSKYDWGEEEWAIKKQSQDNKFNYK